jgi:transposase
MPPPPCCVGSAGAKATRDIAVRPTAATGSAANDASGMPDPVPRLQALPPPRVGVDAAGGLASRLVAALATAAVPVGVVNPRHARDVAKAPGRLAQTAARAAAVRAHGAAAVRPTPRPLPEAAPQARRALRGRRRQLVDLVPAARPRSSRAPTASPTAMQAHRTGWAQDLARRDHALAQRLQASPVWQATAALRRRVPGVGPVRTRTLLAQGPELGTVHRRTMAALGGVAPCTGASGSRRGQRPIWGGRAPGRAVR